MQSNRRIVQMTFWLRAKPSSGTIFSVRFFFLNSVFDQFGLNFRSNNINSAINNTDKYKI